MTFNSDLVDQVLQYALLVAGENDDFIRRDLGPIHLIKYVYLADLFFAERQDGHTFTGTPWRFHKFGPWANEVNERINPSLQRLGASLKSFPSDYPDRDDWVRWSLTDGRKLEAIRKDLPPVITINVRQAVQKFGKDTPDLLDFVYRTKPMLEAAPGDHLSFQRLIVQKAEDDQPLPDLRYDNLSKTKKKRFGERMRGLQAAVEEKGSPTKKLIDPVKNARYDEIYQAGLEWLESLGGEPLEAGEYGVQFHPEVWKSKTRGDPDVS